MNMNQTRRELLRFALLGSTVLVVAGCATGDGRVGVPVNVTLPPEVIQIIADSEAIINQGKKLLGSPATQSLVAQAEGLVGALKSGSANSNFKTIVGGLTPVLASVGMVLPPPYNLAAGVLVAVAKAYLGHPIAGRLAMSPEAARRVMEN